MSKLILMISLLLTGFSFIAQADTYDDKAKIFASTHVPYPVESHLLVDIRQPSPFTTCTLTSPDGVEKTIMHAGADSGIYDIVFVQYQIPHSMDINAVEHQATEMDVRSNVNSWVVMGADQNQAGQFLLDGFLDDNEFNPLNGQVQACKQYTKWISIFQSRSSGVASDGSSYDIRSNCADNTPHLFERFRLVDNNLIGERFYGPAPRPSFIYCTK